MDIVLDDHRHGLVARSAEGEWPILDVNLDGLPHDLVPLFNVRFSHSLVVEGLQFEGWAARLWLPPFRAAGLAPLALHGPGARPLPTTTQGEDPVGVGPDVHLGGVTSAQHEGALFLPQAGVRRAGDHVQGGDVHAQFYQVPPKGLCGRGLDLIPGPPGHINDQLEGFAAGQIAEPIAVLIGKVRCFKVLHGQFGVISCIGRRPCIKDLLALGAGKVPGLGADGGLLGCADAAPGDVHDAITIHRGGEALAEVCVPEQVADALIRSIVLVDDPAGPGARAVHPARLQVVVAGLGLLGQEGDVERVVGATEINLVLALRQLENPRLPIRHDIVLDVVDVRQLVALGVHLPVVRVALKKDALAGGHVGAAPGKEARIAGRLPVFVGQLEVVVGGVRVVRGVELLEVVTGLKVVHSLPKTLGQREGGDPVGGVPLEDHGIVIGELDVHRITGGLEAPPRDLDYFVVIVGGQVIPPEL